MPLLGNYVYNFPHCTIGLGEGRTEFNPVRALGSVCPMVGTKYHLLII